jgi:hypothetical protein
MNFFLCKKCDKLIDENAINSNLLTNNDNHNNEIYYSNTLFDSYISSKNLINDIKLSKHKLSFQEDELQIIDYPYAYETKRESRNNNSKSTLKIYNFDETNMNDANKAQKLYSIKDIFSNLHKKKYNNKKRKTLIINNNSYKKNNNFEYYFIKKNPRKYLTQNTNNKFSNNIKKFCKAKTDFNKLKKRNSSNNKKIYLKEDKSYKKNNNNTINQERNNNSFQNGKKIKDKKSFNSIKSRKLKDKNENYINNNNFNTNLNIMTKNKIKKNSTLLINDVMNEKFKNMNDFIYKKNNANRCSLPSSDVKIISSRIIKSNPKKSKKNNYIKICE